MAAPRRPSSQGNSIFTEAGIPSAGMDTDTVPRLLPPTKAPLLKNFLMDRPGVLPMRGPICEGVSWNPGASIGLHSSWVFDDTVLLSKYAASATATRDYWVAPYRKATAAAVLRTYAATVNHIDLRTGTITNIPTANVGFARAVRVGQYVYGFVVIAANMTQDGFVYPKSTFQRWDGSTVGFLDYSAVFAPSSAQDITYHYNRLFVLGGITPGGTRIQFNSLYWSDPIASSGAALPAAVSAWQDDVSGLTNQLVVGSDDANDFGVALAHVGQNLLILKRRSMWVLYGTSPSNWVVKQVSNEIGCIDQRSVVEYDGGVFFMSERGFMFYDGTRVQNVSGGLQSTLVANARRQSGTQGVDGGYVRAAAIGPGYILVTTGAVDGATLAATADTDAWLLHAPSGAWTQLSSGALPTVIAAGRTTNHTYLMSDQKLVKANYLFNPVGAPVGTRGFDSLDSGATKFIIPSRWTTRALALGTPPRKSKLQRITADYYWSLANGGWQVTTNTRGANGVVNSVGTLAAPTGIAATLPARGAIDTFNETDELYLDIAASSGAPAAFNDAELHRVLVESTGTAPAPAAL